MDKTHKRFWDKVDRKEEGCWEWTASVQGSGYGQFAVTRKYHMPAHRFSYQIAYGDIPDGLLVCHRCDNRRCVRPDHLFLGTYKDNYLDMIAKGRGTPGGGLAKTWRRFGRGKKLTVGQVQSIRKMYADGTHSHLQLSEMYRVNKSSICQICTRRTWKDI